MAILLTTNLSNIALVLWFVHGLDWGVQGAARASVLAEWSGALLGLALTRRDLARRPGGRSGNACATGCPGCRC